MGSKFGINREVDKINEVSKVSIDKLRLDSFEGESTSFYWQEVKIDSIYTIPRNSF